MNKRGEDQLLLSHVIKIIFAVISLLILITIVVFIYMWFTANSELEKAEKAVNAIVDKAIAFKGSEFDEENLIIMPPDKWFLRTYVTDLEGHPSGQCLAAKSCVCVCQDDSCSGVAGGAKSSTNLFCRGVDFKISLYKDPTASSALFKLTNLEQVTFMKKGDETVLWLFGVKPGTTPDNGWYVPPPTTPPTSDKPNPLNDFVKKGVVYSADRTNPFQVMSSPADALRANYGNNYLGSVQELLKTKFNNCRYNAEIEKSLEDVNKVVMSLSNDYRYKVSLYEHGSKDAVKMAENLDIYTVIFNSPKLKDKYAPPDQNIPELAQEVSRYIRFSVRYVRPLSTYTYELCNDEFKVVIYYHQIK